MSRKWPTLRNTTTSLVLDENLAPSFPAPFGQQYFVLPTERPEYVFTERLHPATEIDWQCGNLSQANYDELWAFWGTTLARGSMDFTAIDHERRMLFDASWTTWSKTWKRLRGGVQDVPLRIASPYPWTLPIHAAYTTDTPGSTLVSHTLDTSENLTLSGSGELIDYATSTEVLRKNGYALRTKDKYSSPPVGASNNSMSFSRGMGDSSISVFGQFKINGTMSAGATVRFVELADSSNVSPNAYIRLYMTDNSGTLNIFAGWGEGATTETIQITGDKTMNTWYDVGVSHDAVSGKTYLYFAASVTAAQWSRSNDFLYSASPVSVPLSLVSSDTAFPSTVTWTTCNLVRGAAANVWSYTGYAYGQNVFIFNGHMTPHHFNFMRRVSHMWNNKTTGTWPK